jgi:molybdenum cofactor cytidylyltransferase
MVSAILLAAGESKRMGQPKLLLPFGKYTILEQTIDNLLASKIGEVIVVLGYKAQEMIRAIADRPVKIVVNPSYQQGMSTSIIAGLNLVDAKAKRLMIVLADQPLVDSQTFDRLIDKSLACDKGIIIPIYGAKRGNPVILSTKYREELLRLRGDVGARWIIKQHYDNILEVAVDCDSINVDIDIMGDYHYHIESAT